MHFDPREQAALREAGLSTAEIQAVADDVAAAAATAADELESFFDRSTVYSDMDAAHGTGDVREHDVEYLDLFTHAADVRGYLRFASWGVWVADGRILCQRDRADDADPDPEIVELTLGPTVHDRVRFADDPGKL